MYKCPKIIYWVANKIIAHKLTNLASEMIIWPRIYNFGYI